MIYYTFPIKWCNIFSEIAIAFSPSKNKSLLYKHNHARIKDPRGPI
jgi:hypothetical protein